MSIHVMDSRMSGAALKSYVDNIIATDRMDPTDRDLTRLYTTSFIGRRAANKRGDAVSSVKMKILDSKGEPLSETQPLVKMLARGYRDTVRRSEITLCFWGRNLLFKRRSYNGNPYGLRWVNPNQYILDQNTVGLKGFNITRLHNHEHLNVYYIPRADGVYMTEMDFDDDYDGVSPMEVAFRHAQLGVEMAETQTSFMQNRAVPAAIVQPMSDDLTKLPTAEQTTKLSGMLKRLYQGSRNAGRTLLQTFRWEWIQLQGDWDKMDFGVQFDQYIEAVAMSFDIPVPILRESANYAQTVEMRRDWAHNWLVPRVEWYAELFTEQLLQDPGLVRQYGTGLVCQPDLESAALLKEDDKETIGKTNAKLNAGYIDLYTAAIKAGEKEPDERLKGMYMWGSVPTPITALPLLWQAGKPTFSTDTTTPPDNAPVPPAAPVVQVSTEPVPTLSATLKAADWIADDVFAEIKVAARKGKDFVPAKLHKLTADYMAALHGVGVERERIIEAGKSHHLTFIAAKAVQATRLDFEGEFETLLERARNDEATRQQFRSKLAALLNKYSKLAYMDGLRDGGLEDDEAELSAEDKQAIAEHLASQSAYVTGLADTLFKGDGVTDMQAVGKAAQWWNGSVYPSYLKGLEAAGNDPLVEWVIDSAKENCETCLSLSGMRQRLSTFTGAGFYPNSDKLVCGAGKQCGCKFAPAKGKRRGNLSSVTAARSAPHDHDAETVLATRTA
jgi:HK97 family phage portal protein